MPLLNFIRKSNGDTTLTLFDRVLLRHALVRELGDAADPFTLKLNRKTSRGVPCLRVIIARRDTVLEVLRVISSSVIPRVPGAVKSGTGDGSFDDAFALSGANDLECAALLGAETRKELLAVNESVLELDIAPGRCEFLVDSRWIPRTGKLPGLIGRVITLMNAFAGGMADDAANRKKIITNIREEIVPEMKRRMLDALLSFYSMDEEMESLLGELLDDPDPGVRVEAAARLGEKGRAILAKMLETVPSGNSALAALIIGKLVDGEGKLPRKLIRSMALRPHDPALRGGIVSLVMQQGEYHPPSFFRETFEQSGIRGIRRALFHAIIAGAKRTKHGWDGFFLGCLEKGDLVMRLDSIKVLGEIGGVECVERLLVIARAKRKGVERDAARRAVEKIQSRLEGAEGGWLSVTTPGEKDGALSRADLPRETMPKAAMWMTPRSSFSIIASTSRIWSANLAASAGSRCSESTTSRRLALAWSNTPCLSCGSRNQCPFVASWLRGFAPINFWLASFTNCAMNSPCRCMRNLRSIAPCMPPSPQFWSWAKYSVKASPASFVRYAPASASIMPPATYPTTLALRALPMISVATPTMPILIMT